MDAERGGGGGGGGGGFAERSKQKCDKTQVTPR
jgi:hypothetical protein